MPTVAYVAMDDSGKEVKGEIEALNEQEAISKIREMRLFPTKVRIKGARQQVARERSARPRRRKGVRGIGRVGRKPLTQFTRQLSTLQDAGLPLLRCIRILEQQQRPGMFRVVLRQVGEDIEGGSTLSEAFGRYPKAFDRL